MGMGLWDFLRSFTYSIRNCFVGLGIQVLLQFDIIVGVYLYSNGSCDCVHVCLLEFVSCSLPISA